MNLYSVFYIGIFSASLSYFYAFLLDDGRPLHWFYRRLERLYNAGHTYAKALGYCHFCAAHWICLITAISFYITNQVGISIFSSF